MKNFVQPGRNLTFTESQLTKPSHTSTLSQVGDPVRVGRIVGVTGNTPLLSTDSVVVQTEGVYNLAVSPVHGIVPGETVYIHQSTCVLSDDQSQTPFGVALGTVAGGATGTIPVKILGATPGATGFFS